MAKNKPIDDNRRIGAVRGRSQTKAPNGNYVKRNASTGRFMDEEHRNGVQHQGAWVSEERLYLDAMSGLRLFDELLHRCFDERLASHPTSPTGCCPSRPTRRGSSLS